MIIYNKDIKNTYYYIIHQNYVFQSTYLFRVLQYALIRPNIKFITQFKSDLDQCWRTILQLKPIDSSSKVATLGRPKIVMKFVSYSPVIFSQIF